MVGKQHVFVIAEAGVNHNGDLSMALQLCDAAKAAGADAVKFQTFRAEDLVVPGAPTAQYQERATGQQDQFSMLEQLELSRDQHGKIKAHCDSIGIEFFSTPFSIDAVDMLVKLGVRRIKLPSGELTHRRLVEHAAATGLPLIVSTGMATMDEIHEALQWAGSARGNLKEVTVLHCTSAYPAPDEALNLRAIESMARDLAVPVGYSDHSLGLAISIAAAGRGATVIEKHFTENPADDGPDHAASLAPEELKALVQALRIVGAAMGDGVKQPRPDELEVRALVRRSAFARRDIAAGTALVAGDLAFLRPAGGIGPEDVDALLGARAARPIAAGDRIGWEDLDR